MNDELIDQIAWVGAPVDGASPRGIVLEFSGGGPIKTEPSRGNLAFMQAGGVFVDAYVGPGSWMHEGVRSYLDQLVMGVRRRFDLGPDSPLILIGGSMGGHAALTYPMFSLPRVTAVYANCPVTDLVYHYAERPDLPRQMHHAFRNFGVITETLEVNSPVYNVDRLPDIPYMVVHGEADNQVSKVHHSDRLVAVMKERGLRIEYVPVPGMTHCGAYPDEIGQRVQSFLLAQLGGS